MATRRDARCASRNLVGGITAATSVAAAVSACELRATVSRERLAARIGEDHSTDLAGMDGDIERTQPRMRSTVLGYRRNARVSGTLTKAP